tara:strand:- start:158 stop:283 length:126 start_codon:yes stop_codon:yes gene_type:complete
MSEHSESIPWWLENNGFLITNQDVNKEKKPKEKTENDKNKK